MKTLVGAGAVLMRDDYVFMVKTRRRNMTRWEIPSAVVRQGEQPEDTAFRCVFEESNQKTYVRVNSLICCCFISDGPTWIL
jgi:ADP-ribose pyrophosphatase YjhB (NUDIX family)